MKIRLFQIDINRDELNLAFVSYDRMMKYTKGGGLDINRYDLVFDGEVNAATLEDVYYIFNCAHPEGYRGRSLSVSDVVYVDTDTETRCYYCDTFGFTECMPINYIPFSLGNADTH